MKDIFGMIKEITYLYWRPFIYPSKIGLVGDEMHKRSTLKSNTSTQGTCLRPKDKS